MTAKGSEVGAEVRNERCVNGVPSWGLVKPSNSLLQLCVGFQSNLAMPWTRKVIRWPGRVGSKDSAGKCFAFAIRNLIGC